MLENTLSETHITIKATTARTIPAIAKPFGFLKTPTKENIAPKSQIIHPKIGITPAKTEIKASMNPAIPILFP